MRGGALSPERAWNIRRLRTSRARNGLFAVVDCMGGYGGGALAAKMTVLSLLEGLSGDDSPDEESLRTLLRETAERMLAEAELSPLLSSMGATLAGLVLREESAFAFNCGDCRVYRFRSGYLDRLSRDHLWTAAKSRRMICGPIPGRTS